MERNKYVPLTKEQREDLINNRHTAPQYCRQENNGPSPVCYDYHIAVLYLPPSASRQQAAEGEGQYHSVHILIFSRARSTMRTPLSNQAALSLAEAASFRQSATTSSTLSS